MHSFTVHVEGEEGGLVEAQVVQAHKSMALWAVFDEIYALSLDGRLRTEMLIVRLPVDEHWDLLELQQKLSQRSQALFARKSETIDTFDRIRDRSVHILTSHESIHVLTGNLSPYWPDDPLSVYKITAEQAIAAIRKSEFEHILENSRAILTCPAGSEFRAPSGRLVRSFVRVGNIQYSRDAIDAVFFWMLPYLLGVGAILTDTWSISSIALNLAKLSQIYFESVHIPVELLPSYHDGSDAAQARTRAVIERLNADFVTSGSTLKTMLCVISATHTGSLAAHLAPIFGSSSLYLTPRLVALFALGPTELPSLHDLQGDKRFLPIAERLERASQPIAIDPQVYFPLQFEDTIIEIDKPIADLIRPFFDRYVGYGLIEVHRTHSEDAGRARHHGIHLATERLLDIPAFVELYEAQLEELPSLPQLIISPPHRAGRALAQHALAYFNRSGHAPEIYAHPNLYFNPGNLSDDEVFLRSVFKKSTEDDAILIVDDCCITGTRLSQYQRYLRTEGYKGRIDYLVGIVRVPHPDVWTRLRRYLGYRALGRPRHSVLNVDFVLLPDWRDSDCPWCREKRLYDQWSMSDPLPKFLTERKEMLGESSASGLANGLCLEFPGLGPMTLGPESLFTSQSAAQAEVFVAVASALQSLRSTDRPDRPVLGPRRFPVSTVLNHIDYLRSKWTDSMLRATFLRAALAEELTYAAAQKEKERTEALVELATQSANGEHEIALEILLAANLGKCTVDGGEIEVILAGFGAPEVSSYMIARLSANGEQLRPALLANDTNTE